MLRNCRLRARDLYCPGSCSCPQAEGEEGEQRLVHALNQEMSEISFSFFGCVYFNSSVSCSGYLENRPTLPAAQSGLHSEVWVLDPLCLHKRDQKCPCSSCLSEIPTGKTSMDPHTQTRGSKVSATTSQLPLTSLSCDSR